MFLELRELRILSTISKVLFILCLPLLLLSASIGLTVNSLWLYEYSFHKYDIGSTTGLADSELKKTARGLISYFNSDEEYISLTVTKNGEPFELFNQREIAHLKDVKELIRLDYWVLLGTLIYATAYVAGSLFLGKGRYRRGLAWGTVGGSSVTLILMLGLALWTFLGFDQFFWQLHLISFSNDLWQLDPTRDYLIMLVPRDFWYDVTLFCALATVVMATILGVVAGGYLRVIRRRAKSQNTAMSPRATNTYKIFG